MKLFLLVLLFTVGFAVVAGTDHWGEVLGLEDGAVEADIIETVEEIDELVLDDGAKLKRFRHNIGSFPVWNDEAATVERNGKMRLVSPKKMNRHTKRKFAENKKMPQNAERSRQTCIKHWGFENLHLDFSTSERFIYDPEPDKGPSTKDFRSSEWRAILQMSSKVPLGGGFLKFLKYWGWLSRMPPSNDRSDVVYADLVHFGGETGDTHIVKFCLVNANNNSVISEWEGIHNWDFIFDKQNMTKADTVTVKPVTVKPIKVRLIPQKSNLMEYVEDLGDGNCSLHNVERNISAFDGQHRNSGFHPKFPFTFPCDSGPPDAEDGSYRIIADLFFNAIVAYDMFTNHFWGRLDRVSRDGTVKLKGHYGLNYGRANFDGTYLNFGDGPRPDSPFTCLAVVAHEMGHSVTSAYSKLKYQKGSESGCLNEGFSFIAAPMAQMYLTLKKSYCPEQDCQNYNGCNQYLFEGSQNYSDYFPTCKENAQGGDCCQLPDNCAYLVTSIYYNLERAWNVKDAGKAFVMANRFTWNRETTIKEAGCGVLSMTIENRIVGGDTDSVINAWASVGIDISDCDVLKGEAGE